MSELLEINHLSFSINETGKLIPSSQITYTWKFYLDQQYRIIKLIHSKIKGKRKVFFNDLLLCIYRKYTFNFKYEFLCDKHLININQIGRNYYNLTIDGISFKKLENIQKLNRYNIIRDEYIKENPINLTKSVKELMKEEEEEKNKKKKEEENEIVEFMNKKYKNFEEEEDEKENDFEEKNYVALMPSPSVSVFSALSAPTALWSAPTPSWTSKSATPSIPCRHLTRC